MAKNWPYAPYLSPDRALGVKIYAKNLTSHTTVYRGAQWRVDAPGSTMFFFIYYQFVAKRWLTFFVGGPYA